MSQITDDAGDVIVYYFELFKARYHEHWKPSTEHVTETIELLRSPMPGISGYSKADLIARLDAFFRCKEDWIVGTKYNYSVFVKHIHRWLEQPAKVPLAARSVASGAPTYRCPECENELLSPSEICEKCFPMCSECHMQHLPNETCAEYEERSRKVREMFSGEKKRGLTTTISGKPAFDEKKEFTEKDGKMLRSK